MTSANISVRTVIGYLDVEGMVRATGQTVNSFCLACFNGEYPLPVDPALDKFIMERREQRAKALADQEAPADVVHRSEMNCLAGTSPVENKLATEQLPCNASNREKSVRARGRGCGSRRTALKREIQSIV